MKDRIVNLKIMNSKNRFLFWWEIKLLLGKKNFVNIVRNRVSILFIAV